MRWPAVRPWAGIALVLALFAGPGLAPAADLDSSANGVPPAPAVEPGGDPDAALRDALELERARKWSDAIKAYERALERWPSRVDFRHRLRLCETHFRLHRRYGDRSFRDVLLRLPREQALDLYDEVLERIELQYVEPVAPGPLVRRGFDNLEVALRDSAFLQVNAPGLGTDRIDWLRQALLARRQASAARGRADARAEALAACELARLAGNIPPAAVVLEFTFGACDALDDYSSYLTPDRLDDLYAMIDGNFVGLGVELKGDPEGLRLVGVLKGGPAFDAGLKPGDRITHIDGRPVRGQELDAAANRLQGTAGSLVELTILGADGKSRSLRLARREVEVRSVDEVKLVDREAGIGYVALNGFQKSSTAELKEALADLEGQGMKSLVLDLRGNPGGLLNVAIEMADGFLDSGTIVSTRGRAPGQSATYSAQGDARWRLPMTVLVDRDSASASEILAGALQDNRRATVLGERSYGKGSVQSIFPLRSATAGLKLTTAKFYSPSGRGYSEQGVTPDVAVTVRARPRGQDDPALDLRKGDPAADPVLQAAIRRMRNG
jgi:carboxyl-terminal processing protease